jgi:hypothetical protein
MRKPTVSEWIKCLRADSTRALLFWNPPGVSMDEVDFGYDGLADLLESLDLPKDLDRDTMKADAANPSQLDTDR